MSSKRGKSKRGKSHSEIESIPMLEWVSAGIGLAIVLGMFGFLTLDAIRADTGVPPIMRVEPIRLTKAGGQYVLQVRVLNESRKTGAGVHIEGQLKQGPRLLESSGATLSYVPGQSERRAGLVFTQDPRRYRLNLRVTGFERP